MTTLPNIELHMDQLVDLQREILLVDSTSLGEKKNLLEIIVKSHNLLAEMIKLAKPNKALEYFLSNISNALLELYQVTQSNDDNPRFVNPRDILQQLATTYQESIVPILTRLHNLSQDSDNMLRITSIASLGNEIITCSSQLYQFSDHLDSNEKIHAMLGTILMYTGVGLSITILSGYSEGINVIAALTCVTLGCALARAAMNHYKDLPEADLTRTALANIPTAIAKIDKDPQEHEYLQQIVVGDIDLTVVPKASKSAAKTAKTEALKTEPLVKTEPEIESETEAESREESNSTATTPTLFQKMKSFMGFVKD